MDPIFQSNKGNINPAMHTSFNFRTDSDLGDTVRNQHSEPNLETRAPLPALEIEKEVSGFTKDTSITSAFNLLGEDNMSQVMRGNPLRIELTGQKPGTLDSFFDATSNPSPGHDSQIKRRRQEDPTDRFGIFRKIFFKNDDSEDRKRVRPSFSFSNVGPFSPETRTMKRSSTFKSDSPPFYERKLSKSNSLKILPAPSDSSPTSKNKDGSPNTRSDKCNKNLLGLNLTFLATKSFFSLKPTNQKSITFDAFVDKQRGLTGAEVKSDYPSYKIDKRLV